MTRTTQITVLLSGLALAAAISGGGFAAKPAPAGGSAVSDAAASAELAADAPAYQWPPAGPAAGVFATPVPVLPLAPVSQDRRVRALSNKYETLDRHILGLVKNRRETQDGAERFRRRKEVEVLVACQFDVQQEARGLEVERLRKQIAEVEQTVARDKAL
jgi:hypothetical protein